MKTIAGLKAEIEQVEDSIYDLDAEKPKAIIGMRKISILRGQMFVMQSLSLRIAEDVGKCELVDMEEWEDDEVECKDRPEPQKCEGCKRALEIKRWLE